jgi:hypothetical protein
MGYNFQDDRAARFQYQEERAGGSKYQEHKISEFHYQHHSETRSGEFQHYPPRSGGWQQRGEFFPRRPFLGNYQTRLQNPEFRQYPEPRMDGFYRSEPRIEGFHPYQEFKQYPEPRMEGFHRYHSGIGAGHQRGELLPRRFQFQEDRPGGVRYQEDWNTGGSKYRDDRNVAGFRHQDDRNAARFVGGNARKRNEPITMAHIATDTPEKNKEMVGYFLPKFDGQNLSVWLIKVHQCFNYYDTPDDFHRYMLASYHMAGEALIWLEKMEREGVFTIDTDWNSFVRLIQIRFGQHHEIVGVPKDEQESVEQKGDAIENFEKISGEEIQEATKEQIKTVGPDHSSLTTEKQSTTLPELLESISEQTVIHLGDPNPNGVLHEEGLVPTTEFESMKSQETLGVSDQNQGQKEFRNSLPLIVVKVIGVLIPNLNCSIKFLEETCVLTTLSLTQFQDDDVLYQDEENVFDEMLKSKWKPRGDLFWKYNWWVFKTRWKPKKVVGGLSFSDFNYGKKNLGWAETQTLMVKTKQEVLTQILGQLVFYCSTETGVNIVFFKHRWRWKFRRKLG